MLKNIFSFSTSTFVGVHSRSIWKMLRKTLHIITISLTALTFGVFWGTWFTLTRTIEAFSGLEFMHIGQTIIANVATPMKVLMPSTIAFMVVSLWLFYREGRISFYLGAIALVLMLVTLRITLSVEVPIDNLIRDWTADSIPSFWQDLRTRWQHYHAMRTFTAGASFLLLSVAALFRKSG